MANIIFSVMVRVVVLGLKIILFMCMDMLFVFYFSYFYFLDQLIIFFFSFFVQVQTTKLLTKISTTAIEETEFVIFSLFFFSLWALSLSHNSYNLFHHYI